MLPLLLIQLTTGPRAASMPTRRNATVVNDSGNAFHADLHGSYWPYQKMGNLVTAHAQKRAHAFMDAGPGSLAIARNDPLISSNPDAFVRGARVVISSAHSKPWVGVIRTFTESLGGTIQIDMKEDTAILDVKGTRQGDQFIGGAGRAFDQIIRGMNARGHTGIYHPGTVGPGPRVVIDLAAESTMNALDELHDRSGHEWRKESTVTPWEIETVVYFGPNLGNDLSNDVILYEGTHFTQLDRILDTQGLRLSTTVYGGFGVQLKDRNAVTRAAISGQAARDSGSAFERASQVYDDNLDVPPSLRSEDVFRAVMTADRTELALEAQRALEKNFGLAERYRVTVPIDVATEVEVGDYIRIIKGSGGLGSYNRKVRVMGIQPDEEGGERVLAVETPVQ